MKLQQFSLLLLAVLCLSSCYPEERFWWSPKGDRAMVFVQNQLHLVTADGELGPPLMGEKSTEHVTGSVSWLPDGSAFVCLRIHHVKTWAEALALIPAEEAKAVDQTLPLVLPLLEAATKLSGEEDALGQITSFIAKEKTRAFEIAVQRKYEQAPAEMEKLLVTLPHGSERLKGMKQDGAGYIINELCLLKLDAAKGAEPRVLARSLLHALAKPRVSPKHPVVTFLRSNDGDESASLEVLPLEGGPGLTIASQVSAAYDWLPEGRTLVFMSPLGHEGDKLQSIHRLAVLQESGALMKPQSEKQADGSYLSIEGPDRIKNPDTLATAIMLESPTLQVLPDGQVLFASQPATLPAINTAAELNPHFYLISANGKTLHPIPTAPGDLPANLSSFVASPDGKYIAVVENETDAVAIVEVDTGKTQIISPPHARWKCRTLPAWKSPTELTFVALQNDNPKWMLWSEGKGIRCISEKWPAETTSEWLSFEKEDAKVESPKAPTTDKQ